MTSLTGIFGESTDKLYKILYDSTNVSQFCDATSIYLFKAVTKRRGIDELGKNHIIFSPNSEFRRDSEAMRDLGGSGQYFCTFPSYTIMFHKEIGNTYTSDREAIIGSLNQISSILLELEESGLLTGWVYKPAEYDPLEMTDSRAVEIMFDLTCVGEYNA